MDRIKGQEVAPESLLPQPVATNGIKTQASGAIFPTINGIDPGPSERLGTGMAGLADVSPLQFSDCWKRDASEAEGEGRAVGLLAHAKTPTIIGE